MDGFNLFYFSNLLKSPIISIPSLYFKYLSTKITENNFSPSLKYFSYYYKAPYPFISKILFTLQSTLNDENYIDNIELSETHIIK